MELIRLLVIAMMLGILISLGTALFHLTKGDSDGKMGRALTIRIALSLLLFLLLMVGWWTGLIVPNQYH
ncbi:MAG TPA: twin transmembrane helix small protein [Steroidobacteraceae bacterium]|nr:twin transmembrane helix small protein [Steroidobacteraceae bacterium]